MNKIDETEIDKQSCKLSKAIKIKQEIDNRLFSPDKTSHINFDISPIPHDYVKGQFVVRDKNNINETIIRQATDTEVQNSNSLVIGGIDFDTPKNISALFKFASNLAINDKKHKFHPVSIFPEVDKKERYEEAVKFSLAPFYYSPYIKDRVKKYIMPKITDEDTVFILPMTLSLFSFSVGGREIMMMENALMDILTMDYKLSEDELIILFGNFRVLSIGYAFDPSHVKKIGFPKVMVFSENDRGVLIPEKLNSQILATAKSDPNQKFRIDDLGKNKAIHPVYLITLDHKTAPIHLPDEKATDHSLAHYLTEINLLPDDLKETIGNCLTYGDLE